MDSLAGLGVFVAGVGVGGLGAGLAFALTRVRQLEQRLRDLESSKPAPALGDLPADVWSIVALLKLTSKDNLDALTRLSPEAALAVVKELMPQLFERRVG